MYVHYKYSPNSVSWAAYTWRRGSTGSKLASSLHHTLSLKIILPRNKNSIISLVYFCTWNYYPIITIHLTLVQRTSSLPQFNHCYKDLNIQTFFYFFTYIFIDTLNYYLFNSKRIIPKMIFALYFNISVNNGFTVNSIYYT